MYDAIIIGGGPAGLTAGIYTGRANLKTLIIEAAIPGGNAALTDQIDNYPGFPEGILGSDLMNRFREQAERFGVELLMAEVVKIENHPEGKKIITGEGEYWCRAVIIASGVKRRELGVEGEQEFLGRGVSYCATCDGAFFNGYPVAVVGGGDSAIKEALFLAGIASKVYLIHRREEFRATSKRDLETLLAHDKIELKLNKVVAKITGDSIMRKVILHDVQKGEKEFLEVEGLFVSIGMIPDVQFLMGLMETENGYIVTDENMQTSVEGIFAVGDVRAKQARQVATAVGDGAQAGMAVSEYLSNK